MPKVSSKNKDKIRLKFSQNKKGLLRLQKKFNNDPIEMVVGGRRCTLTGVDALKAASKLLSERKPEQSLMLCDQLIERYATVTDVYIAKVRALLALEDSLAVESVLDQLLPELAGNPGVLVLAARHNLILGNAVKARQFLLRAQKMLPNNLEISLQLLESLSLTGEQEKAKLLARKIYENFSNSSLEEPVAKVQVLNSLYRFVPLATEDEEILDRKLIDKHFDLTSRISIAFNFAEKRRHEKSIKNEQQALEIANELAREDQWGGASLAEYANELDSRFDLHVKESIKIAEIDVSQNFGVQPILIMGLPRSGTTLLEQILGAHSKVGQVGESKAVHVALNKVYRKNGALQSVEDYPEDVSGFNTDAYEYLSRQIERYQRLIVQNEIYVEKELSNFEYVALIKKLFPRAIFIHVNRQPMDIFLSCYRGNIPGIPATSCLRRLPYYYRYLKRMVGLWAFRYPESVYVIDYSDIVTTPERAISQLTDYLGLEWESEMLRFSEKKNVVRTLSVNQVKQNIYTSSIGGWQSFDSMLEPAAQLLADLQLPLDGVPYLTYLDSFST